MRRDLSDVDPLSPESCQKAFKILKDDFGMHHFDPIDPSMPTQLRENDPGSLAKGAELQKRLATSGIIVPIVSVEENKGSIHIYKQAKEIPQYLP